MALIELLKEQERLMELINKKDGDDNVYSDAMIAKWQKELDQIKLDILLYNSDGTLKEEK